MTGYLSSGPDAVYVLVGDLPLHSEEVQDDLTLLDQLKHTMQATVSHSQWRINIYFKTWIGKNDMQLAAQLLRTSICNSLTINNDYKKETRFFL